mgnify:CR=1 FL=1
MSRWTDIEKEKRFRTDLLLEIKRRHEKGVSAKEMANNPEILAMVRSQYPNRQFSPLSRIIHTLQTDILPLNYLSESERKRYVGHYQLGDQEIEILLEGDRYIARSRDNFIVALRPVSSKEFEFIKATKGEKFTFSFDSEDRVTELVPDVEQSYFRHFITSGRWEKSI